MHKIGFNKTDLKLIANLPEGRWMKVLDSSEEKWSGLGSSLPEVIESGEGVDIRGHSLGLFSSL